MNSTLCMSLIVRGGFPLSSTHKNVEWRWKSNVLKKQETFIALHMSELYACIYTLHCSNRNDRIAAKLRRFVFILIAPKV